MAQPILHLKLQMKPELVMQPDLPLKLTPWNPVKNPDFHLDQLPLLKLIAKVNHQQKNPRTRNHVSPVKFKGSLISEKRIILA